ncbi:hypothetical protein, partial [Blastococcus sp. TF02A-35]|uniref:hypothetical protein n=1 Tax=Blastococcus sp. TF02A-35 TaxID=2559612 RepID=UPI001ADD8A6D
LAGPARSRSGQPAVGRLVGAALVALPVLALPDLAWGVAGRLEPVSYPADWDRVRDVLAEEEGDVLVLPFGAYRAFPWNDGRTQLDPAPRWLPRPTVTDDELVVGGRAVAGEDERARAVAAAAGDPRELAALGVGWVLVERSTPGRPVPAEVAELPLVVDGTELALHRVPGAVAGPGPSPGRATAVVVAHLCALLTAAVSGLWITKLPSTVALRRRFPRKRMPG